MSDDDPTAPIDWRAQLTALENQIYVLHHRRQIHDELMALLDAQNHPDRTFRDAFHGMYIDSQVLAIRRLVDGDRRTQSLRRLLGQLEAHRREFTRDSYVRRWMKDRDPDSQDEAERLEARLHQRMANDAFDKFTDAPGDDLAGARLLQADRAELTRLTNQVVRYADTRVAHSDRDPGDVEVTYDEFHAAIDHLGELLKRYHLLIDQGALMTATPAIQGDWQGPFREPLSSP